MNALRWHRIRNTPSTLHRLRPMRQIGPGITQSLDGRKYQRKPIPAVAGQLPKLGPAVCLNGRPHYSKADTKRMKRQRRQLREIQAFNHGHGLRATA